MSYVDPNFDTYALDACARYGILDFDPCMYLKGTQSPYLSDYYTKTPQTPKVPQQSKPDVFAPSNNKSNSDVKSWKKWALGALAITLATTFAIKKPHIAKKIIPEKVRKYCVDHTPKCVKDFLNNSWKNIKSWFKK